MKKILIFSDSSGLARPFPEVVKYEETWINKLSQTYKVHQIALGGATTKDLYAQMQYAKMFEPDIVIVQCGLADCAPRAMSKLENELINNFGFTRKIVKKIIGPKSLDFLRKKRNVTYIKKNIFEWYVKKFFENFKDKLYWIEIIKPLPEYENKIPGLTKNVEEYNQVLKKELLNHTIQLDDLQEIHLMSDFMHFTLEGQNFLLKKVINVINIHNA